MGAALLDVSKVFDRAWHEGILFKWAHSPFLRPLCTFCSPTLNGCTFRVSVNRSCSLVQPTTAGVQQGSVLSPVLYLVYMNNLAFLPSIMLSPFTSNTMYNCSSLSSHFTRTKLQCQLNLLLDWLGKWQMVINMKKSKAICFTRSPFLMPVTLPRM